MANRYDYSSNTPQAKTGGFDFSNALANRQLYLNKKEQQEDEDRAREEEMRHKIEEAYKQEQGAQAKDWQSEMGMGAGLGATAGSIIPGLGTVAGGLIGGGLGAIGGITSAMKERHKKGDNFSDGLGNLGKTLGDWSSVASGRSVRPLVAGMAPMAIAGAKDALAKPTGIDRIQALDEGLSDADWNENLGFDFGSGGSFTPEQSLEAYNTADFGAIPSTGMEEQAPNVSTEEPSWWENIDWGRTFTPWNW